MVQASEVLTHNSKMSAHMGHASSSSSEDEVENQRLLDAVWDHNRKDEVNDRPNQRRKSEGNSRTKQMIISDIKKPSVREMIYQEAHEQFNEDHKNVKATPEFRRFVAKKLSSVLDGKLKMIMSKKQKTFDDDNSNKNEEDTFRLFSTSCCAPNLDTPEPPPPLKRKRPRIGRNTKKLSQANNDDNSDSDIADQRLAEAAISGHQILSFSLLSASFNRTAEKVECNSSKDSSPHVDSKRNRTDDAVNERKVEIKDRELSEGDLPEEIVRKKKKKKKRKNVDTNGSNEDDDNEQVNTENFQTLAVGSSVLPGEKDQSELSEDIVQKRKKKKKRKRWTQCKEWS